MILNLLIAGFGGQGVLFMGKTAAETAMLTGKEVSWLPSYGPEMRGGTANCSVCIDNKPISCPLITEPETLAVLNGPSFDKFIGAVKPGGRAFIDSSLIQKKTGRADIAAFYIPAATLAEEAGMKGLGNIVMLGAIAKETGFAPLETLEKAIRAVVPASKSALIDANIRALHLGYGYGG